MAIGQHLHFHVPWPVDEFLHVEPGVAEGGFRFPLGCLEQAFELVGAGHQPHAPAPAAGGGLDHHRIAHPIGEAGGVGSAVEQPFAAGDGGYAHPLHGGLGGRLVSHRTNRLGGWPHKGDAVVGADLGKAVVFRQKAVAGVDGIGPSGGSRGQNVGNMEVALGAGRLPDAHRFVGQLHVQGVFIHRAEHGHRRNAQLPAGAQDSQGNLATVGDQQLADGHPRRLS